MPLLISFRGPTLLIRREAFERAGLTRAVIDERFNLTPEEFRVEGSLVVIGPLVADEAIGLLTDALDGAGLAYFDDFFDLSGNWPDWLKLFAMSSERDVSP